MSVFGVWKEHGRLKIDLTYSFETPRADNVYVCGVVLQNIGALCSVLFILLSNLLKENQ